MYKAKEFIESISTEYETCNNIVFDTETPGKKVRILTIGDSKKVDLIDVTEKTIWRSFCGWIFEYAKRKNETRFVLWAHNIKFDLAVLFNQFERARPDIFCAQEIEFSVSDCFVKYTRESPVFGRIEFDNGIKLELRDTLAFFKKSLDTIAKDLGIGHKIEIPAKWYNEEKSAKIKKFRDYAIKDTKIVSDIVDVIMSWHKEHDCDLSVSIANLSMKVFLKELKEPLINCPDDQWIIWNSACHGGKGLFSTDTPKWSEYKKLYVYDIVSSYPYAMTQIPSFTGNTTYKHYKCKYKGKASIIEIKNRQLRKTKKDFLPGIYLIDVTVTGTHNPVFYNNCFDPVAQGERAKIWTTGYELQAAIETDEIELHAIIECITIENCGSYHPLKDWALYWFDKKQNTPKTSVFYDLYKVGFLNSISGKFHQMHHDETDDCWITAKFFSPSIYSQILGFGRAQLLKYESIGNSVHAATDSVFCKKPIPKKYIGKKLGQLNLEIVGTTVFLGVAKRYIVFDQEKTDKIKYAYAGFQGSFQDFLLLYEALRGKTFDYGKVNVKDGIFNYVVDHMPQIKQVFRSKESFNNPTQKQIERMFGKEEEKRKIELEQLQLMK